MTHQNKCEEKARYREEKQRHREEKRKEKQRHREEKRELKKRHREEKRKHREQFVERVINMSLEPTPNVVVGHSSSSNVRYNNNNNFNEISSERDEHEVATLRTIFPDCDPSFIRNCLANETKGDRVRKVAEKLLSTSYPKVAQVTPSTPPTAPPLLGRSSFESPFEEEAPPSYEETVGSQSLQPPPLPNRHQRSSSWNGTSSPSSRSTQSTQSKNCPYAQISRTASNASLEVADAIGTAVKNIVSSFKPSSVERACHKNSYVWSRPVPSHIIFKPLSQQSIKILPKDKYSIQKGFNQSNFPSKELRYRDISEEDWYHFVNGLNSLIGVNSIKGNSNNFGEGFSVGLKWVSWMSVTMDEPLMESNVNVINEYIAKWNNTFFNPRQIMMQFIDDRTAQSSNPFRKNQREQYLLLKSI